MNGAGRAVLISDEVTIVVLVGWVDIGLAGVAGGFEVTGLAVGGTRVVGWTTRGLYAGSKELEARGVVARSRGLLGLGSGLMSSGSQLILGLRLDMLATRGWSYS